MNKALRAISWAAVSTNPQASEDKHSIPSQLADNRAVADERGWFVVDEITVPGHSRYYDTIAECAVDMRLAGIDAYDRLLRHWEARDADVIIVRDADRFARTLSMGAEFVSKCYRAGMSIYSHADGHISNERQALTWIAGAGVRAQSNVMFLVEQRKKAAPKLAKRGMYINGAIPDTHEYVRDGLGKRVGVRVNERMRLVMHDAAILLLENIGFREIEQSLYTRFGHTAPDGGIYAPNRMYSIFTNPYTWGHTASNLKAQPRNKEHAAPVGAWLFESGHAIPEGVSIEYNTHESIFSGDLAERVKSELRRRFQKFYREGRYYGWASRLFACAECGHLMQITVGVDSRPRKDGVKRNIRRAAYIKCFTRWHAKRRAQTPCTQTTAMKLTDAQILVSDWLNALRAGAGDIFGTVPNVRATEDLAKYQAEVERIERTLNRLILQRADAPEGSDHAYIEQIKIKGQELKAAKERLQQASAAAADNQRRAQAIADALQNLRNLEPDAFWNQPDATINRQLLSILGNLRFAIRNGQFIGFQPAPPDGRQRAK